MHNNVRYDKGRQWAKIGKGAVRLFFIRKLVFSLLLTALFLIFLSCEESGGTLSMAVSGTAGAGGAGSVPEPEANRQVDTIRKMVLSRGNQWVSGIPGFGANNFSALSGEYRLSPRAGSDTGTAGAGDFMIYLTMEKLFFSGDWVQLDNRVLRRHSDSSEGASLTAVLIDDHRGASWIAVFEFPRGDEETVLGVNAFNQLLQAWAGKFLYFLSLSKTIGDISLPAVVEF